MLHCIFVFGCTITHIVYELLVLLPNLSMIFVFLLDDGSELISIRMNSHQESNFFPEQTLQQAFIKTNNYLNSAAKFRFLVLRLILVECASPYFL